MFGLLNNPEIKALLEEKGISNEELAQVLQEEVNLIAMTGKQRRAFQHNWKFWARNDQRAPRDKDWTTWILLGGRGSGKTRAGAEWVHDMIRKHGYTRIALVGETAADVRDVMIEGESGLMATAAPAFKPAYFPSKRRVIWPNGAYAIAFSAEDPEQLRGPQHDLAWCDELAKWRYAQDTWDNLQFGLRLGDRPLQLITTTPRPLRLIRELIKEKTTRVVTASTYENRAFLAATFFDKIVKKYEGTRLGRQELLAELLDDNPYALWNRTIIDEMRVRHPRVQIIRALVAVDPPASSNEGSDECGIIVVGLGSDGQCYVLADGTIQGVKPEVWADRVRKMYELYECDAVVAEVNNGGDMVESVIRNVMTSAVRVIKVHATRGKVVRAEPISALYTQRRVHHVGAFPELEDQMCEFTSDFDRTSMGYSPDRVDALVWGLTELTRAYDDQEGVIGIPILFSR